MPGRKNVLASQDCFSAPQLAAAYVRMSTEHQQYSTENQLDTLKVYAATHGLEICKVYTDSGKSGLRPEGRDGLQQLFKDVGSGACGYGIILVYDVSRWGRFQDPDESASYEVRCRQYGVKVEYCAEQFVNDGSPISSIVKSIKRMMAGEYSRELSVKVFKGQSKLIELGFRQGGTAGYALRRQLIDVRGIPKAVLERGQHKSLQTDRVVLIPGPEDEQQVVKEIYRYLVSENLSPLEIARKLNSCHDTGQVWTSGKVLAILTNEKYIGNNVWNRRSSKLKGPIEENSEELWVRANRAFLPIVEQNIFDAAQAILSKGKVSITDDELIRKLKKLLHQKGELSKKIIDAAKSVPSGSFYADRFGGMSKVYALVGYEPYQDLEWIETRRQVKSLVPIVRADVIKALNKGATIVATDPVTGLVVVNNEITVSVVLAWFKGSDGKHSSWRFNLQRSLRPDITVVARLNHNKKFVRDYFIIPMTEVMPATKYISRRSLKRYEEFRFDTLDALSALTRRKSLI